MLLDINTELFSLKLKDKFYFVLSSTLSLTGEQDTGLYDQSGVESLADGYQYVMHGKVYKFEESAGTRLAVFASFGGLLMRLESDEQNLKQIKPNTNLYLLIKKI